MFLFLSPHFVRCYVQKNGERKIIFGNINKSIINCDTNTNTQNNLVEYQLNLTDQRCLINYSSLSDSYFQLFYFTLFPFQKYIRNNFFQNQCNLKK